MTPAYRDRERDILEAYVLRDITLQQACKYLDELKADAGEQGCYYEFRAMLRLARDEDHCNEAT